MKVLYSAMFSKHGSVNEYAYGSMLGRNIGPLGEHEGPKYKIENYFDPKV